MVRDYSERRQARTVKQKPRPAVWPYVLFILLMVCSAFTVGLGTGWYLFRPGGKFCRLPAAVTPPSPKNSGALPPQGQPLQPLQPQSSPSAGVQSPQTVTPVKEKGSPTPPLTFYNTLQKGGSKELMGTGINNPKEGQTGAPKPASPPLHPER